MANPAVGLWLRERLVDVLFPSGERPKPNDPMVVDISENILAYDDKNQLIEFLMSFDPVEQKVRQLCTELFERKAEAARPAGQSSKNAQAARSPSPPGEPEVVTGGRSKGRGKGKAVPEKKKEAFPAMDMPMLPRAADDKRLIVFDSASGRHEILTNCLNCGKVIAASEGPGPCLFCGNALDLSRDDRGYHFSAAGAPTEEEGKYNQSFESALERKNNLLSYQDESKKRTTVYDDANDWFSESNNAWLSEKQRKEASGLAQDQQNRDREDARKNYASIDILGRTVIDSRAEMKAQREKESKAKFQDWQTNVGDKNKKLAAMMEDESRGMGGHAHLGGDSEKLYDKLRAALHSEGKKAQTSSWDARPADEFKSETGAGSRKPRWDASIDENRNSTAEFASVSQDDFKKAGDGPVGTQLLPPEESPYVDEDDSGQTLSMHQPWASLLIHGFKRAEGRSWKTNHRGRLWIHAASKPPDDTDVIELENRYRKLYDEAGVNTPVLPSQTGGYPTSALLGCVDLEECWSQDEYLKILDDNPRVPQEENASEFIFWCLRPRKLSVPVKMGGDNKIWTLRAMSSLQSAQRELRPVRWPVPVGDQQTLAGPPVTPKIIRSSASKAPVAGPDRLDLWPAEKPSEQLLAVTKDTADRDVVILSQDGGFVHLVDFIPMDVQQRLIDELREIGISDKGFFAEGFDSIKVSPGVSRLYLGTHWNTERRKWEKNRGNVNGTTAHAISKVFLDMYSEAVKRANRELTTARGQGKKKKYTPLPEGRAVGTAVVNFYSPGGSMQLHQDKTEPRDAIDGGFPVMCICLGDACDLAYSTEDPASSQKPKLVRVQSGDIYLFGGASRAMWHGVDKVHPRSGPPQLRLLPGRLSITLRPM